MESTKEVLVTRTVHLLKFDGSGTATANGITVTRNASENSITITGGTPTAQTSSFLTKVLTLPAGSYVLYCPELQTQVESIYGLYVGKESVTQIASIWSSTKYRATFTLTEETKLWVWASFNTLGSYDNKVIHAMIFEGNDTTALPDFEPYYREYESTKEVLVRRSNNLLLPFSSDVDTAVGKNKNFSSDSTFFVTVETDGNIHIHGTKSVANSGWYLISNFTSPLVLKAGKTYSIKCSQHYGNFILQSTLSGSRKNVIGNYESVTPTIDTPITYIYIDMNLIDNDTNIGKEYDFYINPMLVEGDTKQDYEPYYYEAEASKTEIIPDDGSLTSVVDFSNAVKGKRLNPSNGVTIQTNGAFAYTPDYYSCETGEIFKLTYVGQEHIQYQDYRQSQIMWYDTNKNFLSHEGKENWVAITFSAAPANAKFFRLNYSGLKNDMNKEWMLPSNPKLTKVTS